MTSNLTSAPRPGAQVVLRIGVTGHRHLQQDHREPIRSICQAVIECGRASVAAILAEQHAGYSNECPSVRVVTSLAEGSDQIMVEAARQINTADTVPIEVWAILPYPASVYRSDFVRKDADPTLVERFEDLLSSAKHRTELDGSRSDLPNRLKAYEQAGKVMLAGIDVLISICSPEAPLKEGGSVAATQEALASGMPVIAVNPDNPTEVQLRMMDFRGQIRQQPFTAPTLQAELEGILRPPTIRDSHLGESNWKDLQGRIICLRELSRVEQILTTLYKLPWKLLTAFSEPRKRAQDAKVQRPMTPFKRTYELAEQRSKQYAILWRGSFMLNYLLGASAVTCALLQYATSSTELGWTWAEALTLSLLLANFSYASHRRWHAFFGDMRFYAELLRQARAMSLIGAMIPQLYGIQSDSERGREAWINWYCRALQRSCLPADGTVEEKYNWTVNGWIQRQMHYQHSYSRSRLKMEKRLTCIEVILFAGAALCCILHLTSALPNAAEPWLVFVAAAAPAWAAAFHAIGIQGEFRTVAEASELAARQIKQICEMAGKEEADGTASHANLILIARDASPVMMQEAAGWRTISQMHEMLPS